MGLGNISFEQEPVDAADKVPVITNWNPMIGYMLYQDDISGLFFFKLVLEVRLDDASGTLIAKIKQRRNGYSVDISGDAARAFFDLRDIVNSQLTDTVWDQNDNGSPFETIHKLGENNSTKPYSLNGDHKIGGTQLQTIYVKGYQEYGTTANSIPTEDSSESVNDTLYYMGASLPLFTARDVSPSDYIQTTAFSVFQGKGSSDRFLSDVEVGSGEYNISGRINYVQWDDSTNVGDYHTVAFLNDNSLFDSDIGKVEIIYYDSEGNDLNTGTNTLTNSTAFGGMTPGSANEDKERIIYFGCGPGNLQGQSLNSAIKPSDAAVDGWAYYTVKGESSAGITKTDTYYFIRQDASCKGFKVRRLAWRNSLGCYDYFNFKKKSTQRVEVTRNNYSTMMGNFRASKWYYNNTMRGKKTRQVTAVLKETLNTDWITEQDANLLEKLIMSTDVYIVENADTEFTQGVMITDSSFVRKTRANDKMIQYTIQIEYANPINTNS
tara:strand:+ start:280 stop:1758 length:1479 start_codon:yes stop_codon:yes gene_type:complete